MENVIFEIRLYLRCFMHAFSKNTVNSSVFEEVAQNTVKSTASDMLCCQSVANSGVFATLILYHIIVVQPPWNNAFFGHRTDAILYSDP